MRRIFSPRKIIVTIGSILFTSPIWSWLLWAFDWWHRIEFAIEKMPHLATILIFARGVLSFAISVRGNFIFMFLGAVLIIWVIKSPRRYARAIDLRDRLDDLVRNGEGYLAQWMNNKHPKWRTELWLASAKSFVRSNFKTQQIDAFSVNDRLGLDDQEGTKQRVDIALKLQNSDPKAYGSALATAVRIDGLKRLRAEIIG